MSIAATQLLAFVETPRKTARRLCRRSLVLALVILLAIQAVLVTGAWEYAYAKLLIPDVIRTDAGFATPPLVTVRDHYIVDFVDPRLASSRD